MALALNNVFNSLTERHHRGRSVFIKARGGIGQVAHKMANFFFRVGKIPIAFCTDCHFWQRWEVRSYRMLNRRFAVYPIGEQKVAQEKLPGVPLFECLEKATLRRGMVRAAAREFRRAHSMPSDAFHDGLWSHGDATMANVIFDPATKRARLIDFEILHRRDWPAVKRHADDLMVFLFDLVSLAPGRRWLPLSLEFLRSYDDPRVIAAVRKRLKAPAGLYRIWWHVRTNFVDTQKVMRRLMTLRTALEHGEMDIRRRRQRGRGDTANRRHTRMHAHEARSLVSV